MRVRSRLDKLPPYMSLEVSFHVPIIERREVSWRGRTWRAVCERITGSRFRIGPPDFDVDVRLDDLDADRSADLTVDGTPGRSFLAHVDEYGGVHIDVELANALPLIEFIPHRDHPARPGDISYADALARASADYPVDASGIRETASYWVFPVFQIGSCGVLIEKATGHKVGFGSHVELDAWIWGYEHGLLDEPPRDLVVVSVRDRIVALRALRQFVRLPEIDHLPMTFPGCAGWLAIKPLMEAADALEWRCERQV